MMSDIASFFYKEALKNTHRFKNLANLENMRLSNYPVLPYKVGTFHILPGIGLNTIQYNGVLPLSTVPSPVASNIENVIGIPSSQEILFDWN